MTEDLNPEFLRPSGAVAEALAAADAATATPEPPLSLIGRYAALESLVFVVFGETDAGLLREANQGEAEKACGNDEK